MKAFYKSTGLGILCGLVGMTRAAYYDRLRRVEKAKFDSGIIVDLVKRERKIAKRVSAKRLHLILKSELLMHQIEIGRDKFLEVLRDNDLLVKRKKRRIQTTMSRHRLRKYPNISKDLLIDRAEQLWVSDITYLDVENTHCYLILITDAYSRIFKSNFALDEKFVTFEAARRTIDDAIEYYNNRLPHSSVDMLTPNEAHLKIGKLKKHWKWYWKEKQELLKLQEAENVNVAAPNG